MAPYGGDGLWLRTPGLKIMKPFDLVPIIPIYALIGLKLVAGEFIVESFPFLDQNGCQPGRTISQIKAFFSRP